METRDLAPPEQPRLDEAISAVGLIWSDRVNWARSVGCFGGLRFLFPKTERAAVGAVLSDD